MNYLVVIVAYFGFNEKRCLLSNARDNTYHHLFSTTVTLTKQLTSNFRRDGSVVLGTFRNPKSAVKVLCHKEYRHFTCLSSHHR